MFKHRNNEDVDKTGDLTYSDVKPFIVKTLFLLKFTSLIFNSGFYLLLTECCKKNKIKHKNAHNDRSAVCTLI